MYEQVIYCNESKENSQIHVSNVESFDIRDHELFVKTFDGYEYTTETDGKLWSYDQDVVDMIFKMFRNATIDIWKDLPEYIDKENVTWYSISEDEYLIMITWADQDYDEKTMDFLTKNLRCPFCKSIHGLKIAGQNRLETLDEHVCNPNGESSLKDTYKCNNKSCKAYTLGYKWNQWGDVYFYSRNDEIESPINSYRRGCDKAEAKAKKFSFRFSNKYGMLDLKLYDRWTKKFKFEFIFWKRQEDSIGCVHTSTGPILPALQFFRGF